MAIDRTQIAVTNQLKAMQAERYEIGVSRSSGAMLLRTWNQDDILKNLSWLKAENRKGAHIYIRPFGSVGLILIDDLTVGELTKLESDGYTPAAVTETSPQNYQAWIRITFEPITKDIATAIAKLFADRYDADPNSADWRHFGRLAGFTNRKPKYVDEVGHYPFVMLRQYKCKALLEKTIQMILLNDAKDHAVKIEKEKIITRVSTRKRVGGLTPSEYYQRAFKNFQNSYGHELNESKADWRIAKSMAEVGYSGSDIRQSIIESSPNIEERKKGHVTDYVNRTVDKIFGFDRVSAKDCLINENQDAALQKLLANSEERGTPLVVDYFRHRIIELSKSGDDKTVHMDI